MLSAVSVDEVNGRIEIWYHGLDLNMECFSRFVHPKENSTSCLFEESKSAALPDLQKETCSNILVQLYWQALVWILDIITPHIALQHLLVIFFFFSCGISSHTLSDFLAFSLNFYILPIPKGAESVVLKCSIVWSAFKKHDFLHVYI